MVEELCLTFETVSVNQEQAEAFRRGYRAGILFAHCLMAWAMFPAHPNNAPEIWKMLKKEGER